LGWFLLLCVTWAALYLTFGLWIKVPQLEDTVGTSEIHYAFVGLAQAPNDVPTIAGLPERVGHAIAQLLGRNIVRPRHSRAAHQRSGPSGPERRDPRWPTTSRPDGLGHPESVSALSAREFTAAKSTTAHPFSSPRTISLVESWSRKGPRGHNDGHWQPSAADCRPEGRNPPVLCAAIGSRRV
jgi:hypothetical protein